jgi:hypothetical protein
METKLMKSHQNTPVAVPPLHFHAVERVVIYHIGESATFPIAIWPSELESFESTRRFESDDPQLFQDAYTALRSSRPFSDPRVGMDAHWGVVFIGRDGERLLAAYTGRFGLQGVINGNLVGFEHSAFFEWLKERFVV